jgi:hypothetical protein
MVREMESISKLGLSAIPPIDEKYIETKRGTFLHEEMTAHNLAIKVIRDYEEQFTKIISGTPLPHEGAGLIIGKLNALERYERRALSRRNKALAALRDYDTQNAIDTSRIMDAETGPPPS